MSMQRSAAALLLAAALGSAQAAAPIYAGTLGSGSFSGTVEANSGPFSTPQAWSLWRFSVPFGSDAWIEVTPGVAAMDVVMAVWFGEEADTAGYFDMSSGGLASTFVAGADLGGPGVAESLGFNNLYGSGPFVLAVADYADGLGSGSLPFTITSAVPEPGSAALLLAGVGLLALARRRQA